MTDLRTRIAQALQNMTGQITFESMADAVIAELGLDRQTHYDPDCHYYRYVTDWINPLTGNKVDLS